MRTPATIHLIWASTALGAFFLGSQFFGKDHSQTSGNEAQSHQANHRDSHRTISDRSRSSSSREQGQSSSANSEHRLSSGDIEKLGDQFRAAKGPIERHFALSKILEALTPENAQLLREQIVHLDHNDPEFKKFHYAWGAMAGKDAVLFGQDSPKKDMATTLSGWMSADPDSAVAYFRTLPEKLQMGGGDLKWGAATGLADADPALAIQFATERFESGDRDARKMVNIAINAAIESGDIRNSTSLVDALPQGELNQVAHRHIFRELASTDPKEAVTLAQGLPAGEGREHALGSSFHTWAGKDPVAAASQLNTITNPAERDAATYGYATRFVRDDPATGVEWASTIKDPAARQRALIETGRVYYRRDRNAAKEWLASSGLPEDTHSQVTSRKRRRRQ